MIIAMSAYPLDRWYVAGFAWEISEKPLARTLLGQPVVLFRVAGAAFAGDDNFAGIWKCGALFPR